MMRQFFIGILITLLPWNLLAQTSVSAALSNTKIMIGDQVNLQIRISQAGTAEVDIDLAELAETEGLEIVKESDPILKEDTGLSYLEKNIILTSFDSGEYVVPQITVRLLEAGKQDQLFLTNPIPLTVLTIPVPVDTIQLADIKDIEREAFALQDGLPYLLGALGTFLVAFLIWWFFIRKPAPEPVVVPTVYRSVHDIAFEKLEDLQKQKLWQQDKVKPYYSQLTYIAREYLENRYKIAALESTTGEILREMKEEQKIEADLLTQLHRILNASDLVKFAKAKPAADFHKEAFDTTHAFINTTKDIEAAPIPIYEKSVPQPEDAAINTIRDSSAMEAGFANTIVNQASTPGTTNPVQLASFWQRFFARLIDLNLAFIFTLIVALLLGFTQLAVLGEGNKEIEGVEDWILGLGILLVSYWFYFAYMTYWKGGSVGKLIMKIRVVNMENKSISLSAATIRFIGRLLSETMLGLGYITYFFNKKDRKSLPDIFANTRVIKKPQKNNQVLLDHFED